MVQGAEALVAHPVLEKLKEKVVTRSARVGVFGLGYVGLPLAVEKAKAGFTVTGFERSDLRRQMVTQAESYIKDVVADDLHAVVSQGRLVATDDMTLLQQMDVLVICVPTPLTATKDPDLQYVEGVTDQITAYLRPGQLITLESTTYPGTTEQLILGRLLRSGLTVGKDFFLAFSPERVDPGNPDFSTRNIPKLVGGVTPACLDVATAFYGQTIDQVMPVTRPSVAEMAKVFENTYRAVNIALVNELMLICNRMDIDVWEVLDAAGTKPFGIQVFYPGPGVGGHCIPIDPYYLAWKAREYGLPSRFIELAGEINESMPYYVVDKVTKALNQQKKCLNGSEVLLLGLAYKRNVDDYRESPSLKVWQLLEAEGARISYHDPFVPEARIDKQGAPVKSVPLSKDVLQSADCTVILTNHDGVDYEKVVQMSAAIVDCRNATREIRDAREKVFKL